MNTKKKFCLALARRNWRLEFLARSAMSAATLFVLLALLPSTPAFAADGRDFAALYRSDETGDLPGKKPVTVFLRLFNYSGADITGATVVMESPLPRGKTFGSIAGVSIDDGANVTVSGGFVIPDTEYARWRTGASPQLMIEYVDNDGNQVQRPIELTPAPMPMGEQP